MRDLLGWAIVIIGLTAIVASFVPVTIVSHKQPLKANTQPTPATRALNEGKIKLAGMKTALAVEIWVFQTNCLDDLLLRQFPDAGNTLVLIK